MKHILCALLLATLSTASWSHADPAPEPSEVKAPASKKVVHQPGAQVGDTTLCPVMGSKFKVREKSPYVEYKGEKVYFCCAGCETSFNDDPARHLAAMKKKVDELNKP